MADNRFFNEQEEQSRIKALIVANYFKAWATVILSRATKIAYIDLFAGPGRYEDGAISTPLEILANAVEDEKLQKSLVAIFNDKDVNHAQALQRAIHSLPGVQKLRYEPVIFNEEVGEKFVQYFASRSNDPSFLFVDPWGYKGLSLRLVNAVLKDWGSDCVFFFNYNRINMGLSNEIVMEHMAALFGQERAMLLSQRLNLINSPEEREAEILEELVSALHDMGGNYVLPFRFRNERGSRTTHYLIFVSKHFRGYEIMKGIMAKMSSSIEQGVPSFEYSPATERQPLLFALRQPLDELGELLLQTFAGKTLTCRKIYEQHSVNTPFIEANYKNILLQLEERGKVVVTRPSGKPRRPKTFPDDLEVTFPD